MEAFNIAILGCGTVGGGVARIIQDMNTELDQRTSRQIRVKYIVELAPKAAMERFDLPGSWFCGGAVDSISTGEANKYIEQVINDPEIHLVVETIGGTSDFVHDLAVKVCNAGKHIVTANKALLAEKGSKIFEAAGKNNVLVGYEAAVCGAIPIIKSIKESFTGDQIISVSGIMNGTSNYILSRMTNEGLGFQEALKLAQENGFAEADPTLDINGGDAGHKLVLLIKLAFGKEISWEGLSMQGIENIDKEDIEFAEEIDSKIKLICYAKKIDGKLFATVCPMMVKNSNFLSEVNGATNAVRLSNKYSGKHILVGAGAGSFETASSIVADIVFIARHANNHYKTVIPEDLEFADAAHFEFPYIVKFVTSDVPGITGLITTAFGNQNINIDTVSHNRRKDSETAIFSVATTTCTLDQINSTLEEIKSANPNTLLSEPKIMPILY